jgi:hypothetical protein
MRRGALIGPIRFCNIKHLAQSECLTIPQIAEKINKKNLLAIQQFRFPGLAAI